LRLLQSTGVVRAAAVLFERDSARPVFAHGEFWPLVGAESKGKVERAPDILNGRSFSRELGDGDRANIKYAPSTLVEIGRQAGCDARFIPTEPIELP
jgi:hypothetical protein